jgi:hypothetical protein
MLDMSALISILLFLSTSFMANAESCEAWFKRLKIASTDVDCEMKCAMGGVDMGSFDCPSQCDRLCRPKAVKKPICPLNSFWKGRLRGPSEPFKSIAGDELQLVMVALSRLPKSFRPMLLKVIVKGTRPSDFAAPSTEATSTDEFIILYPRAFSDSSKLDRIIVHEVVHVLILKEWSDVFEKYKKTSGWSAVDVNGYRKGEFVEYDGKSSPEEDLANNVEYFLFDRDVLNQKSPDISAWLQKNLGQKIRLEKGCQYEK